MSSRRNRHYGCLTSRDYLESQSWQQRLSDAISNASPSSASIQFSESGHGTFLTFVLDYGLIIFLMLVALVLYFQE